LSGAVHVERQQNGDEELFRPPLLVNDLAAVAKLVMSGRQAWAHHILLYTDPLAEGAVTIANRQSLATRVTLTYI
jgi:hypothetical protein